MDTSLHDPLIGTLLDGRYRVEQLIATGGMATVYRATDTRLDRVLAVKVMHPGLAADAEYSARFIREAKAVARLAHPNVVNVFDQGTDGGRVFLAMEYVPGRTLRDLLRDRGALSARAALDVLEPVLAALGAAHRAGLVHRDVKPENVLITEGGLVKVADFGLVRVLDDSTRTSTGTAGTVLGTVAYLAPEQIRPEGETDQRVDVYAAGILLYELLTGARPHTGENPVQVIYQHLHEDVPPPSRTTPTVAPELDAIVAAATARDPQGRPHDAVALLAALQRARRALTPAQLDAEPPASLRPTPVHPTTEPTTALTAALTRTTVQQLPPELLITRPFDEPLPERPPRRRRSRRPLVWGVVLAVLLTLVGGTTYVLSEALYTQVPSVLGQREDQAVATLDQAGLQGVFTQDFSETVPTGQVIATDPGVGARVRKSDPVKVSLSKGPQRIAVPNLTGLTQDEAEKSLTTAGLTAGTVDEEYSDTVEEGDVISSSPGTGAPLPVGSAVALTVSKGMTPVPDVKGMTREDAAKALSDAGFQLRVTGLNTISLGKAKTQTPAAGQPLRQGSPVDVDFSLF
ncbi:serine/threonine protein kinase [Kitasatospora sp. MMS16-BH015]|uniref:Stk1 family PASTA domain-containing Ser/Thr kinase n=1 Tax=Kitasatospora sp. MMS16-BH015 TaxID=2018025 RepID=UPI000CA214EA|nr:Stk1 family PASTA domain-containing Ser/Thr kinase [Kitasatospora sp. MMS16-BH015]AUG76770.1 serine/threonine protein kinase [Kitasatospora sp. MMS16-BH015]